MYYNYDTANGEIRAFISFSSYNDTVSIYLDSGEITSHLYSGPDGDLCFDYLGETIKFKDFKVSSMAELKAKYKQDKDSISSDQLMQSIISDGMDNVRFMADMAVPDAIVFGMGMCTGKTKKCVCKLVTEYNSMPHDKYKVKLRAVVDNDESGYACDERMYVDSFDGFISNGMIEILDSIPDGKTSEQHIIEYYQSVTDGEYFDYKMKVG